MEIVAVPAFSDNYIWLVHDEASGETVVVDPGDGSPGVRGGGSGAAGRISQIWNTHWHPDHTGGNLTIKEATGRTHLGSGAPAAFQGATLRWPKVAYVRLGNHVAKSSKSPATRSITSR